MGLASLIEDFRIWRESRLAIADLRRLNREDEPFGNFEHMVLLDALKNAAFRGDIDETMKAFNHLRAVAPGVAISSETAVRSLLAVGKIDLAESVLEEGLRKYPGIYILMLLHADIAGLRGDWMEANRRWKAMRRKFPDNFWVCFWGAVALKENGQFGEADKLLERAIAVEPIQPVAAAEYARVAERRGDLQEALRRWGLMRERIDDQAGWLGSARIMCQLDRDDEAIELLTKAGWRFQSRPEPLVALAEICDRRGPKEEAARQWQALREKFPHIEQGYISGARALRELGRHDEAEAVLQRYADKQLKHPSQ
jgi:predicted Zn-dependent protease